MFPRRLCLCVFLLLTWVVNSPAWTILRFGERDYVPLREVQAFYEFTLSGGSFEEVRLVKPNRVLVAQVATKILFLNNLRFHLSLPIVKENGVAWISRLDLATVVDPVLRPGEVQGPVVRTIILDPGHGGNDQGTASYYGTEKFYALDLALRIAPLLRAAGLEVLFTRESDTYLSPEDRVQFANQHPNSLFISLHFNAGQAGRGIETFTLTPQGVPSTDKVPAALDFQPNEGNAFDAENIALATAIHGCVLREIHLPDRGLRRARFHVLKGIRMPGVLFEGGYLGGQDAYTIDQPNYRQTLAEGIALGIRRYLHAVPQSRMELASKTASPSAELPKSPETSNLARPLAEPTPAPVSNEP